MDRGLTYEAALAALAWQIELGADEAIGDLPVDRYALTEPQRKPAAAAGGQRPAARATTPKPAPPPLHQERPDPAALASAAAADAQTLEALAEAMRAAPNDLQQTARNFVFADGQPAARVMLVGEAPGRDEDEAGLPFVGRAGQLLDRMLAAINLSRATPDSGAAVYITNVLPWRPPANRTPEPAEIAQFLPFLRRHIELADPDFLVLLGNTPLIALTGRGGITRMRGQWAEILGRPAIPMFHPAYLLRNPSAKREAWADLLSLRARLDRTPRP